MRGLGSPDLCLLADLQQIIAATITLPESGENGRWWCWKAHFWSLRNINVQKESILGWRFLRKNNITNPKNRNNFVHIWCFSALPWQNPLRAQDYGHSFPEALLGNTVFAHSQADVKCLCQASQLLGKQAVWHFRKASSVNPGTPSYSFLSKWKLAPNLSPSCTQAVHSLCLQCFALAPTKSSGAEHPQLPLADMELCLPTNPSK